MLPPFYLRLFINKHDYLLYSNILMVNSGAVMRISKNAKIKTILKLAEIYKDSSDIYELYNFIVLAAEDKTYNELLEIFKTKFPNENINKVHAIARQYQLAFQGRPDEYLENLEGTNTLSEVLEIIKDRGQETSSKKERVISELKQKHPDQSHKIDELAKTSVKTKYYPWILSVSNNSDSVKGIAQLVYFYDKNNLAKNLESFSDVSELKKYLDEELLKPLKDKHDVVDNDYLVYKNKPHALNPKYTDYIYESENFTVVLSGTVPSSQYWASGTVWCTSWAIGNLFESYSASENLFLFYIITKKPEIYEDDKAKKKICVGYMIDKNNKPKLVTEMNATVDAGNNNLSKDDIVKYLGSEANEIFNSMNSRMTSNPKPKYSEFIENLSPEEYRNQLKYLNKDDIQKLNLRLEEREYLDPELLNEIIKSYVITDPLRFLTDKRTEIINLRKDESLVDSAFENLIKHQTAYVFFQETLRLYSHKKYLNDDVWIDKIVNSLKKNDPGHLDQAIRDMERYLQLSKQKTNKLLSRLKGDGVREEFEDSFAENNPDSFLHLRDSTDLIKKDSKRAKIAIRRLAETDPLKLLGGFYYTNEVNKDRKVMHDFIIQNFSNAIFNDAASKVIAEKPEEILYVDSESTYYGSKSNTEWVKAAFISLLEKKHYSTYCNHMFSTHYAMYSDLKYLPEMIPYNLQAVKGLVEKDSYKYFSFSIYEFPTYEVFIREAFINVNKNNPELVSDILEKLDQKYKELIGNDLMDKFRESSVERAANKFIDEKNYQYYFINDFHNNPKFKYLTDIAAEKCSANLFFSHGLHKISDYQNLAMEKINELDVEADNCYKADETLGLFRLAGLENPPYESKFLELLTNVASNCPYEFFIRDFQTKPQYKDISLIAAKKYIEDAETNRHMRQFLGIAKNIVKKNSIDEEYDPQEELEFGERPFGITRGKLRDLESALNKIGCRSDRLSRLIKII